MPDDELTAVDTAIRRADRYVEEALLAGLDIAAGLTAATDRSPRPTEQESGPVRPYELAQNVLARVEPAELPLLPSHTDQRRSVRRPRLMRRWRSDTAFRFGVDDVATLLTPVVVTLAHEVLRHLTADALEAGTGQWKKLVRRRSAEVRRIVRETAREAGLPEERVEELADAVVDALDDSAG